MNRFLSCDWGTSSFRLRLVDADSLRVIAEEKSSTGIAETFQQWQQTSSSREQFYAAVINRHVAAMETQLNISLAKIPVILSGMASSSIGMKELPYKTLPFQLDGSDLSVQTAGNMIIISGATTGQDVMRGEETKIVGCAALLPDTHREQLLILPGTHAKHVTIRGGQAKDFRTFMTGEFFELLSARSVLAASVKGDGNFNEQASRRAFEAGVEAGGSVNLLHAAFLVRTNDVLKKMPPQENYFYLSGLLIGAELREAQAGAPVYLAGGPQHLPLYTAACETLHIAVEGRIDADEALVRGQHIVWTHLQR